MFYLRELPAMTIMKIKLKKSSCMNNLKKQFLSAQGDMYSLFKIQKKKILQNQLLKKVNNF